MAYFDCYKNQEMPFSDLSDLKPMFSSQLFILSLCLTSLLSALLKSEAIRKVLRAPNKKVKRAVVKTNPLKNIRTMLQLNPYAAVQKKNAELIAAKNLRAKAAKAAKVLKKPVPADPMAKRAAKTKKKSKK